MSSKKNSSDIEAGGGFVCDFILRLRKAVVKKGGQDGDLYRLVTFEGEETLDQVAELIAKANKQAVSVPEPESLLKPLGVVTVPTTTKKFIANDKFKVGDADGVNISHVGDNFKLWLGDTIVEPAQSVTLNCNELVRSSIDGPIIVELGGENKAETMLSAIYVLMERRSKGQLEVLLTNGYANIFYVLDVNGVLRAVGVLWLGGGWRVDAYSVGRPPGKWDAGSQVLSGNSGALVA